VAYFFSFSARVLSGWWVMQTKNGGKSLNLVVIGSPNVNPGYELINNRDYPEIADDYARMFRLLKSFPCDTFLGAHGITIPPSHFASEGRSYSVYENALATMRYPAQQVLMETMMCDAGRRGHQYGLLMLTGAVSLIVRGNLKNST
jgi:hypothetical protein